MRRPIREDQGSGIGAQIAKKEKMQVAGFRPQGGASKGSKLAALLVLTRG